MGIEMALEDVRYLDRQRWVGQSQGCLVRSSQGSDENRVVLRPCVVELDHGLGQGNSEDFSFGQERGGLTTPPFAGGCRTLFSLVFVLRLPTPGSCNI